MTVIFLLVVIIFLCLALYRNQYWKRRGIDGPQSWPFFGSMLSLIDSKRPPVLVINEWTQRYGRVFGYQHGWKNVLVLSDPNLTHEVFVNKFECFGERRISPNLSHDPTTANNLFAASATRWRRLRSITNPVFSNSNLKQLFPILSESAAKTMGILEAADYNTDLDIISYCREYSMDIIMRCIDYQESRQFQNSLVSMAVEIFANFGASFHCHLSWIAPVLGPILGKFGMLVETLGNLAFFRFVLSIRRRVVERKKNQQNGQTNEHSDFIDFFLNAETTTGEINNNQPVLKKRMTVDEITSSVVVILLAGFETSANTLTLIFYYLAHELQEQEKLHAEIQAVCENSALTFEHLNKLRSTSAFIHEILRLHPVGAFAVSRVCTKSTNIKDIAVEAGTHVQIDILALHKDEKIWGPDALEFKPERWLDKDNVPTFFAFGVGRKSCIGKELALIEMKVLLVHLLRNFKVLPVTTMEPLKFHGLTTLCPTNVKIRLEKRTNN